MQGVQADGDVGNEIDEVHDASGEGLAQWEGEGEGEGGSFQGVDGVIAALATGGPGAMAALRRLVMQSVTMMARVSGLTWGAGA